MSAAPQFVLPSIEEYLQHGAYGVGVRAKPAGWYADVIPNFGDWQPGDIVLMGAHGVSGLFIFGGQWVVSPAALASCRWSHCGIYVDEGYVVDALPRRGIHVRSLVDYCQHRMLTVRRATVGAGVLLPRSDGQDIADFARSLIGQSYAMAHLLQMVLAWGSGKGSAYVHPRQAKHFYCSSLVVEGYANAASIRLDGPGCRPCLPAVLDNHPDLVPVPVAWMRAVP